MTIGCPFYTDLAHFYLFPRHFTACNRWEYKTRENPKNHQKQTFVVDQGGDRYSNEEPIFTRIKCLLLTLFGPPVHTLSSFWNTYRIIQETESSLFLKIARIALTPLTILAMTFSSLYGIFMPWNGRKLYASLERFHYQQALLAPCFQPSSDHHSRRNFIHAKEPD